MDNKIEIKIPSGFIEIDKKFPMPINLLLSDIRNPEKKGGNFSKTLTFPGTKNNNKIFTLFEINEGFTFFNPNIKTHCIISVDSEIIINGYLQLKNINKKYNKQLEGDEISYECLVYDNSVNFFKKIGDKKLEELNFSAYNHTLAFSSITESWQHTYKDIYVYPQLYNYANTTWSTENWTTSIFHKAYIKQIARESGFALGGSFMDDDSETGSIYNKEIIPYNGDLPKNSKNELELRKFRAGPSTTATTTSFIHSTNSKIDSGFVSLILDDDSTGDNFDNDNSWDISIGRWTVPKNGKYALNGNFKFRIKFNSGGVDCYYNYDLPGGGYANIQESGTIGDAGLTFQVVAKKNGSANIIGSTINNFANVGNVPANIPHPTNNPPYATQQPAFSSSNNWEFEEDLVGSGQILTLQTLNQNEYIDFYVQIKTQRAIWYQSTQSNANSKIPINIEVEIIPEINPIQNTHLKNAPIVGAVIDGDQITLSKYVLKDFKQKDLVKDIINRYNLFLSQDPDNENKIMLDSREDFYKNGGTIDWTNKKDYSKKDKIELLSEFQNKEALLTYAKDKDEFHNIYFDNYDETFGQKLIEFQTDYAKGRKEIKTKFASTPSIDGGNGITLPSIYITETITNNAPRTMPRILYYSGVKDLKNGATWNFEYINPAGQNATSGYTVYPMALHTDDDINPTIDLNFEKSQAEYMDKNYLQTNNNLYNRYWRNYITTIDEGKMVTSYFNLTPADIAFVRKNMGVKIFVKDSYYVINKIVDFDLTSKKVTKVELIKYTNDVSVSKKQKAPTIPIKTKIEIKNEIQQPSSNSQTQKNQVGNSNNLISGKDNLISNSSNDVLIIGDSNVIDSSKKSGILGGNNNRIIGNNSWIIGANNKTINENNIVVVGDIIIKNGKILSQYNFATGGVDSVFNLFPTSTLNFVRGGVDAVRNPNFINLQNFMRGGIDKV